MPTVPDRFPAAAAKKASSPEVAALFHVLSERARTCAQLEDALLQAIIRNREARSGKPFQYSKRQQKTLDEFDRDAEKAQHEQEVLAAGMDDVSLLVSALAGEEQQLQLNAEMHSTLPTEVQDVSDRFLEFHKETIQILNDFIEGSPLKGKVRRLIQSVTSKKKRA